MARFTFCLASCATFLVVCGLPFATAATERFLVAVVRDDGKLHPFGMVDEGRWKPAWRPVAKTVEVPIRLSDIPPAWLKGVPFSPTWRLVPEEGLARDITVTRASWAPSFCRQQVLLDSGDAARTPMRPARGPFVPKHGLATMGGGRAEALLAHDAASPLRTQLTAALAPHVNRVEEWQLRGVYLGVFVHPYSLEQRRGYPIQVINVHEGPGPHGSAVWFEALRRYPRDAADADLAWCDIVTFASGWMYNNRARTREITITSLAITSCLLDAVSRRVPLGVVSVGDQPTWVFEEQSADSGERITVYMPPGRSDEQLLLETPTGHCRG